jgi:plastocyanin
MTGRIALAIFITLLASSASAAQHTVLQKGMSFVPETLTVKAGDTVVFKNDDRLTHNVYSKSASNSFNLKALRPGASESVTLSAPGEVQVRCAIHPKMKMTIDVKN